MNRPRIVVIGAMAVDVKAHSFGPLVKSADVPGRVQVTLGGVARNMAKNLALLGADVTLMSAVGDDEFGRMLLGDVGRVGVRTDHVLVAPDKRTATWVGVLDSCGDLDVGVFGGEILQAVTPDYVRERAAAFAEVDLVSVDATCTRATIDAVVMLAQAFHRPLYLNPASVARAGTVADCVGDFTLMTANALEAQALTGQIVDTAEAAASAARALVRRGVQRVIVTLGASGIVYADADLTRYAPAYPAKVVDTTGAGDALAATFLMCHLEGCKLDETLRRSVRAAARTVECEESVNEHINA